MPNSNRLGEAGREERDESELDEKSWDEQWLLPYVEDSTLWPVLVVVIAHAVAFVAPILLFAVRDGRATAMVATLGLGFLSVQTIRYELRRRQKVGALTWVLVITWVSSVAVAVAADRTGFM
jgi:hypothetical protein